jgi:hypothetical protein
MTSKAQEADNQHAKTLSQLPFPICATRPDRPDRKGKAQVRARICGARSGCSATVSFENRDASARVKVLACHLGDHLPRLPLEELRDLYQFS